MELRAHDTVESFLGAAGDLLLADEARHNLAFGICTTLREVPDAYAAFHLWTVTRDGDVVGAALLTPPFNLVVARPVDPLALAFTAEALHREGIALPGVTAAQPEAEEFAAAWTRATGTAARRRMGQGIYAARTARVPESVPGGMRPAVPEDRPLLVEWLDAFADEALPPGAPRLDSEPIVERRLTRGGAGFVLWEDDGRTVSLAGYGGSTPHGIRIGPVYTPPELRARGYASALVACLTRRLLDEGRDYCFLYTDLANPTSNRIYMNVGYELVCESAEYAFD